jgi:GNAT superfamily N-acetyltransferase
MKMACHSYTGEIALKDVAGILLRKRMFEESGQLQDSWARIAETGKDRRREVLIIVAWAGPKLSWLAGCLLYDIKRSYAQFYVPPSKRRKGVASAMLKRLRELENYGNRVIHGVQGYPGSLDFFEQHFVYVPDDTFGEVEIQRAARELREKTGEPLIDRWRSIRLIQTRRKQAFRKQFLAAKKAGKI